MASKRRLRRMCQGKRTYTSKAAAYEALLGRRQEHEGLHAYKCPFGAHWHVGHRPVYVQKAIEHRLGG